MSYINETWQNRADNSIAHGALTNSKRQQSFIKGVYPTHMRWSNKCYITDVDGRVFIDYICGLGTNYYGYGNKRVKAAVEAAMISGGCVGSIGSTEEVKFAERMKGTFPFLERVRFVKSGSEGCSAAVKIARAFHGTGADNENMQEMWIREAFDRILQEGELDRWPSPGLQNVCQSLPTKSEIKRDQKESLDKIQTISKGDSNREETCDQKTGEDQGSEQRQNILSSETLSKLRGTHQEIVRSMWRRELAGPSSRLHETPGRSVAMQSMPRKGARWLILSDGYHGFHDEFVSLTHPANGVPPHHGILPLFGNEDLISIAAAVIIEPVITDGSRERIDWLKRLRDMCHKHKTILIFDETITAVRYKNRSVAQTFNILPDLWVAGKALCGGLPMSVVGGRADVMEADYFVSSTWAGDRVACMAGLEACNLSDTTYKSEDLWYAGELFMEEFNSISPKVQIVGYPTRGIFEYGKDELFKALFMQEMCKARVLIGPTWFYNKHLVRERENVINIARSVVRKIMDGKAKLEGEPPQSPFAQKVRHG